MLPSSVSCNRRSLTDYKCLFVYVRGRAIKRVRCVVKLYLFLKLNNGLGIFEEFFYICSAHQFFASNL